MGASTREPLQHHQDPLPPPAPASWEARFRPKWKRAQLCESLQPSQGAWVKSRGQLETAAVRSTATGREEGKRVNSSFITHGLILASEKLVFIFSPKQKVSSPFLLKTLLLMKVTTSDSPLKPCWDHYPMGDTTPTVSLTTQSNKNPPG